MNCTLCARHMVSWKKGNSEWQRIEIADLPDIDFDILFIRTSASQIRACQKCRQEFTDAFTIPEVWWEDAVRSASGYFGYQECVDSLGNVISAESWLRVTVKQISRTGHFPSDILYHWHKLNIFIHWSCVNRHAIVLAFDVPKPVAEKLPSLLLETPEITDREDFFWIWARIMGETVKMQDKAVTAIRDCVRQIEKSRQSTARPAPDYPRLHDLARHATHVLETLDVVIETVSTIKAQHEQCRNNVDSIARISIAASRRVHQQLLFHDHMFRSLRARAAANKERLSNEIQLTFNMVAQYDAGQSIKIGRTAQSDSAAMRSIAFITLTFLPATFISSTFSTSFFSFGSDSGSWSISDKFWIYWVIAIPITFLTIISWVRIERKSSALLESDRIGALPCL